MRAHSRNATRLAALCGAVAAASLGCKGILDLEPGEPFPPEAGVGGSGTGGHAAGGGGMGGGGGAGGGIPHCGGAGPDHVWSFLAGDDDSQTGLAVAVSSDETRVAVAGRFAGTLDLGDGPMDSAGETDGFVAFYDASGGLLWATQLSIPQPPEV